MRLGECTFLGLDDRDPRFDPSADVGGQRTTELGRVLARVQQTGRDRLGDQRRRQLAQPGQQPLSLRHRPLPAPAVLFVELAVDARAHVVAPVVELLLQGVFEHLALLLDHQDLVESGRELAHRRGLERPHHPALEDADAEPLASLPIEPEILERLHRVEVRLAAGHDAEPGARRIDHRVVEPVRPHVSERRVPLVVEQPRLLRERRIRPPDVEPVRIVMRIGEVLRDHDPHAVRIDLHRRRRLDHLGHGLHRDPQPRPPRHRPAVQTEVEVLLHRRRVEDRQAAGLEHMVGLMRQRRALRAVVVTGEHQHAAVTRGPGRIRVLEHVAGAVDPRALAVPHREHAIDVRARRQRDLLRAPHGGRGELFVEARLEHDPVLLQVLARLPQRLVHAAERRAAVAGNEAGGVQPGAPVALALKHRQAHQRLGA